MAVAPPPAAVAYLEATRSYLHQLSSSSSKTTAPDPSLIQSHFSLLSALIPLVPKSLLVDNTTSEYFVIDPVLIFVRIHSSWLTDEALHSALHCIAQLLDVHRLCDSPWSDACHLFDYLLGFATSPQLRLRTSSSQAIEQVLRSFGDSPRFLEAASEALTRLFERLWSPVLSGGGKDASVDVFGRVLDVLSTCLVFMSLKFKIAVLGCFKAVLEIILRLELRIPQITRGLEMCLERLCLHLKSIEKPQLSHRRKRKEFDYGSVEMMAEAAIYGAARMTKKIKL